MATQSPATMANLAEIINEEIVRIVWWRPMDEVQWTWYRHEDCDECAFFEDLNSEEDGGEDHCFCMHPKAFEIQQIKPRPEPCPHFIESYNSDKLLSKPRTFDEQFTDLMEMRVPQRVPSPSESFSMSDSPSLSPSPSNANAVKINNAINHGPGT